MLRQSGGVAWENIWENNRTLVGKDFPKLYEENKGLGKGLRRMKESWKVIERGT